MIGTVYGIGVGPGDPELITAKAVRLIRECPVVAVPISGGNDRVALQIARDSVPELEEKELLELPMPMTRDREKWNASHDEAALRIADCLRAGRDVAFLVLGDSTIYSTYTYVHKRVVAMGLPARFVPGVPSFCAVAARLNIPLVEGAEAMHVLPASYAGAENGLDLPGTKVLMKTGKALGQVKRQIKERNQHESAQMVQKCGMEGERVFHDLEEADEDSSYFSIIVVKEERA